MESQFLQNKAKDANSAGRLTYNSRNSLTLTFNIVLNALRRRSVGSAALLH
jgi:hypothetical protein